ncbi:hypothetical protein BH20ACI1_BH20ACI1_10450 [soil metagenome]
MIPPLFFLKVLQVINRIQIKTQIISGKSLLSGTKIAAQ